MRSDEALRDCQFVMMTGDWVGASRQTSVEYEADDYLAKPFNVEEFTACLDERYRQANL
jgi:DNA-binding response OmpR family regulator